MIASVPATWIRLVVTSTRVLVTALWAPMTSLLSRLISSPVLLLVKKRIDMRCRWEYSAVRRSRMIPEPIVASSLRCQIRITAPATGMAIRPAASRLSRAASFCGSAVSIRSRTISGVSSPRPMVAQMLVNSRMILPTYGRA